MSAFHSVISRRDFMKALGVTGAGIGTAGLVQPAFRDLDDLGQSDIGGWKRPWWVKQVEKPTIEIDWDMMQRYDQRKNLHLTSVFDSYKGAGTMAKLSAQAAALKKEAILNKTPGYTLRDAAISGASGPKGGLRGGWDRFTGFLGVPAPFKVATPATRGVPKWEGTPEGNFQMVRAAMRLFGAHQIGVTELNPETTKKLIFTYDRAAALAGILGGSANLAACKYYEFEDVEKAYETKEKHVIPNSCRYVISYTIPMSKEAWRTSPSEISNGANNCRYRLQPEVQNSTQAFFNGLGYQCLGSPEGNANGIAPQPAFLVTSGIGEANRINQFVVPEDGTVVGGPYCLITDLPLSPTPPIDAGTFRFCHTCKKCADNCPSSSIMTDNEPTWECAPYQSPGHKAFFKNDLDCHEYMSGGLGCSICIATCTFNVNDVAAIHKFVKGTIATTSLLDSVLWKADAMFGYGAGKSTEEWWNSNLPVLGYDSTIGATHGGY